MHLPPKLEPAAQAPPLEEPVRPERLNLAPLHYFFSTYMYLCRTGRLSLYVQLLFYTS
jgi:hypothetical protein